MNKEEPINIAIEAMKQDMIECLKTANIAFEIKELATNRYFLGASCGYKNSLGLLGCETYFGYERVANRMSYVKSIEIDGIKTMMGDLEESCEICEVQND